MVQAVRTADHRIVVQVAHNSCLAEAHCSNHGLARSSLLEAEAIRDPGMIVEGSLGRCTCLPW